MWKILVSASLALSIGAGTAMPEEKAALVAEGKALIAEFGQALKAELSTAMADGGPVAAISVCNVRAPEIAAAISGASGWSVARSSHKLRNPGNAPDAHTARAIEGFLARQAAGEKAADLASAVMVEEDGRRVFRMVKAIPTAKLCLTCHGGAEVPGEVAGKLAELYPDDQARDFAEGEMRGVFTLAKSLD